MATTRREFLKELAGLSGLVVTETMGFGLLAAACGGDAGGAKTETTAVTTPGEVWHPGKLAREITITAEGSDGRDNSIRIGLFTRRSLEIDTNSLGRLINLYSDRGGVLPSTTGIFLVEKDLPINQQHPEIVGQTSPDQNLIRISLGRIFSRPDLFIPQTLKSVYRLEHIANGVFAGEICNLMFSESRQFFGLTIPPTKENIQLVCDSAGLMVTAISAGRTHEQYLDDVATKFHYGGQGASVGEAGKALPYDRMTYTLFQQALERPILEFR